MVISLINTIPGVRMNFASSEHDTRYPESAATLAASGHAPRNPLSVIFSILSFW